MAIPSGQRRHLLTLETPGAMVPDGDGGYLEGWDPIAEVWGSLAPAAKADLETIIAGTVTALLPYLAVVPYVAGVTTDARLTFNGRTFAILAVRNVDERNIQLEIVCEERVSGGAAGSSTLSADAGVA